MDSGSDPGPSGRLSGAVRGCVSRGDNGPGGTPCARGAHPGAPCHRGGCRSRRSGPGLVADRAADPGGFSGRGFAVSAPIHRPGVGADTVSVHPAGALVVMQSERIIAKLPLWAASNPQLPIPRPYSKYSGSTDCTPPGSRGIAVARHHSICVQCWTGAGHSTDRERPGFCALSQVAGKTCLVHLKQVRSLTKVCATGSVIDIPLGKSGLWDCSAGRELRSVSTSAVG